MVRGDVQKLSVAPLKRKRGRSRNQQIGGDTARNAQSHDQKTRIMAFNKDKLEKLRSISSKSSSEDALPKIQRVQPYLRENNPEYYSPRLVSIGPIHHDKYCWQQGEKYKSRWAAKYLEGKSPETTEQLFQKIVDDLLILKRFYTKDAIEDHKDEDLAWIFFLDGCAVLYFIKNVSAGSPQELKIKADQMIIVQQDLVLLENQLPIRVLELLNYHDELNKLFKDINKFFTKFGMIPDEVQGENNTTSKLDLTKCKEAQITVDQPTHLQGKENNTIGNPDLDRPAHLLHLLRNEYIHDRKNQDDRKGDKSLYTRRNIQGKENNTIGNLDSTIREEVQMDWPTHLLHFLCNKCKIKKNSHGGKTQVEKKGVTHRNIQELKASGIQVKKNKKNAIRTYINFETSSLYFWGSLYLSEFSVDDSTAPILLNMIAYEMCPNFENNYEISSYVVFLDSLIDNVDDVKDLRKAGVLHNMLGSDEEVAKLFNTISTNLVLDEEIYQEVRKKMEGHYKSKKKTWMAEAWHKYFSNPWSFFAFLAALTALILTFFQTWFAVYPCSNA